MKKVMPALAIVLLAATPASAACPPLMSYDDPALEAQARQERLVCLQREVSAAAEQRKVQVELDNLQRNFDGLQIQRRFDALDFSQPEL